MKIDVTFSEKNCGIPVNFSYMGYEAGFNAAIDRYCPEFTDSGASVTCNPVENYPLGVISGITPIQAGSGEPSPTNTRPITGHTAVKVTVANGTETAEYNTEFGQTAYCGSFDWSTGVLTLTHRMLTLTGEESGWNVANDLIINYNYCNDATKRGWKLLFGWCSHSKTYDSGEIDGELKLSMGYIGGYLCLLAVGWDLPNKTGEAMLAYVKAQAAAGTPIQILYELETPLTAQLTAQEILALSGTNTVYSDTGDTTVTGKGYVSAEGQATAVDYQYALREMGVDV